MNKLSLNNTVEYDPKSNNNNVNYNSFSADFNYKESNYKNNVNSQGNFFEENKKGLIYKPLINPISETPNPKCELKNGIDSANDFSKNNGKENEKNDFTEISNFIKNKKFEKE